MQVFLSILVLITLALLATSRLFYRLRRARLGVMLLAGGWPAIGVGVLLGPHALEIASATAVYSATPLALMGLGWIGLLVGLQARRAVLTQLPRPVVRAAAADALAVALVFFPLAALLLSLMWRGATTGSLLFAAGALAVCSIGWSMETRSLLVRDDPPAHAAAMLVRASGALGALAAVLALAIFDAFTGAGPGGAGAHWAIGVVIALALPVVIALGVGFLGRETLTQAGNNSADQLAVFLGIVALSAGAAAQLGLAALVAATMTGVVLANISTKQTLSFERFILKAEHTVATLFALVAGVLLDPHIGVAGVAVAFAIAAARIALKPTVVRRAMGNDLERAARRTPTLLGPARQSPLALAIAVALLLENPSPLLARVLAIVALAGILSDLAVYALSRPSGSAPLQTLVPEDGARDGAAGVGGAAS